MSVDILEPSRTFPRLLAGNRAPAALPDKPVWGRGRAPFPGPHGPVGSDNRNRTFYKPFGGLSRRLRRPRQDSRLASAAAALALCVSSAADTRLALLPSRRLGCRRS